MLESPLQGCIFSGEAVWRCSWRQGVYTYATKIDISPAAATQCVCDPSEPLKGQTEERGAHTILMDRIQPKFLPDNPDRRTLAFWGKTT